MDFGRWTFPASFLSILKKMKTGLYNADKDSIRRVCVTMVTLAGVILQTHSRSTFLQVVVILEGSRVILSIVDPGILKTYPWNDELLSGLNLAVR